MEENKALLLESTIFIVSFMKKKQMDIEKNKKRILVH